MHEYPFSAFVVSNSLTVKHVTLVEESWGPSWHRDSRGKSYPDAALFHTVEDAIAAGRAKLDTQRAKLGKQIANCEKRAAAFEKYAAKCSV